MKIVHAVAGLVVLFTAALPPATARAADPACLKRLEDNANRDRRRANLYLGEMKDLAKTDNPRAQGSASVCSGAMGRAEQFYKRQITDQSLCGIGSSYVDNQVAVLFKNASVTCHSEWEDLVRAMPPEEQRLISERVNRKAAELR